MSYLNSERIRLAIKNKKIKIDPYFNDFQGPNLYYCHLGNNFLIPKKSKIPVDPFKDSSNYFEILKNYNKKIVLKSKQFILAETFEYFSTDNHSIIRLFNSSSLARLGISHCAAGMINPGCGQKTPIKLTLELVNNSPFPVILQPTVVIKNKIKIIGTEVLKVGVLNIDNEINDSYSKWDGMLYGDDNCIQCSKMSDRYKKIKDLKIPKNSILYNIV